MTTPDAPVAGEQSEKAATAKQEVDVSASLTGGKSAAPSAPRSNDQGQALASGAGPSSKTKAAPKASNAPKAKATPKAKAVPPPDYICHRCRQPGHFIKDCQGNKGNAPPPGYVCNRCQRPGHFINDCPDISKAKRSSSPPRPLAAGETDAAAAARGGRWVLVARQTVPPSGDERSPTKGWWRPNEFSRNSHDPTAR
jgi:hypothetical protein